MCYPRQGKYFVLSYYELGANVLLSVSQSSRRMFSLLGGSAASVRRLLVTNHVSRSTLLPLSRDQIVLTTLLPELDFPVTTFALN